MKVMENIEFGMNLKRQRRPNVRLAEVGDVPAVVSLPYKSKGYLVKKRWKLDDENPNGFNSVNGTSHLGSLNFVGFDPMVVSAAMEHNIENENPNSRKPGVNEVGRHKGEMDLSNVTRKCWAMKRRRSSTMGQRYLLGGAWNLKLSPDASAEVEKLYEEKHFDSFKSSEWMGVDEVDADMDHEIEASNDEDDESDEATIDMRLEGNANDLANCEGNSPYTQHNSPVDSVSKWLEGQGFGKYVDVFEMHEVDEEALPLLTFDDLKEMGVVAVGPRRKLYSAIRQLRSGFSA